MNSSWGLEWKERGGEWLPVVGVDYNLISLLCGTGSAHPPWLLTAPVSPDPCAGGGGGGRWWGSCLTSLQENAEGSCCPRPGPSWVLKPLLLSLS